MKADLAPTAPPPAILVLIQSQSERLQRARELHTEIGNIEESLLRDRDRLLCTAWHIGEVLCQMKDDVGHGRWLPFLAGQLPQLGERDAQRCMKFFVDNPNPRNSTDLKFTDESVRKFMWGYIPQKQRPQLEGDQAVPPAAHHLTIINHFSKWDRQHTLGHAGPLPPVDQMRRDFQPMIERQVQLLGAEWLLDVIRRAGAASRG